MQNTIIPNDSTLLHVDKFLESSSVSAFLPEEESYVYPLLQITNRISTPCTSSHPLASGADDESKNSANLDNMDNKAEISSTSESSSGIDIIVGEASASKLLSQPCYKHLQNNGTTRESNCFGPYGTMCISQETPLFVSWNWPLIRKCSFFFFISIVLGMCAVIIAMMITIPTTCNMRSTWFHGSVIYEISPLGFQYPDKNGLQGIRAIAGQVDNLASLGISAVRLNSIFPSEFINSEYPNSNENVNSLTEIAKPIGTEDELKQLLNTLHTRNMSLVLDLPLYPLFRYMNTTEIKGSDKQVFTSQDEPTLSSTLFDKNNLISNAINKWTKFGVDGFYIKGLEKFKNKLNLPQNIAEWKSIMGSNRVLIISELGLHNLDLSQKADILKNVDLVDVHLNVFNGTKNMKNRIEEILFGEIMPKYNGVWIQWSIGIVNTNVFQKADIQKSVIAATLMQIMLPGTPNIFYDAQISPEFLNREIHITEQLKNSSSKSIIATKQRAKSTEPLWIPLSINGNYKDFHIIRDMIKVRDHYPSIFKNSVLRGSNYVPNTQILSNGEDIIIVERSFPRRNSFVSISNYGNKRIKLDLTSLYYSGAIMTEKTQSSKIYFENLEINSSETIIVKLDK